MGPLSNSRSMSPAKGKHAKAVASAMPSPSWRSVFGVVVSGHVSGSCSVAESGLAYAPGLRAQSEEWLEAEWLEDIVRSRPCEEWLEAKWLEPKWVPNIPRLHGPTVR